MDCDDMIADDPEMARVLRVAAQVANEDFPNVPLRRWFISFAFPLRYLFAAHPQAMGLHKRLFHPAGGTISLILIGFLLK